MELNRKYKTIHNTAELTQLLQRVRDAKVVSVDTETTGLDVFGPDFGLAGVALALNQYEGFYLPVGHVNFNTLDYQPPNLPIDDVKNFLLEVFKRPVVMHNGAFDRIVLATTMGLPLDVTQADDTMLALHLKDENHPKSLKEWTKTLLNQQEINTPLKDAFIGQLTSDIVRPITVSAVDKRGRMYNKTAWEPADNWLDSVYEIWKYYHTGAVSFSFVINFWNGVMRVLKKHDIISYKGSMPTNIAYVHSDIAGDYACDDVMNTLLLWEAAEQYLKAYPEQMALYKDIELPANNIMLFASLVGIPLDIKHLQQMKSTLDSRILEEKNAAISLASTLIPPEMVLNGGFNYDTLLNSPQQLSQMLYKVLGYTPTEVTETGAPSVSKKALAKLKGALPNQNVNSEISEDFIDTKMRYEGLKKLQSTYTTSLIAKVDQFEYVHPGYNTVGTVSGRMSSSNPNFQNLPRLTPDELEDLPHLQGIDIRKAFYAPKGYTFVTADYSSMEIILAAVISKDQALAYLIKEGLDMHAYTARKAFGLNVPVDLAGDKYIKKHHKRERQAAKPVNFALQYGGTSWTLMRQYGFTEVFAEQMVAGFEAAYPEYVQWQKDTYRTLETVGQITYPGFGFIKRLDKPDLQLKKTDPKAYRRQLGGALRSSMNAAIQGWGAYIVKRDVVRITDELKRRGLYPECFVSFQVHDEVGVLAPDRHKETVAEIMRDIMQHQFDDLLLKADPEYKFSMSKAEEAVAAF